MAIGRPKNLVATGVGRHRVRLSWSAASGEPTGYQIEYREAKRQHGSSRWIPMRVSGMTREYEHANLSACQTHQYRIAALQGSWVGSPSDTAWAVTQGCSTGPGSPAAPGNFVASAAGSSRINLAWSAPEGVVTGYQVEWWTGDGWSEIRPAHSGTVAEYAHTGRDPNKLYRYRVRASAPATGNRVGVVWGDWATARATTDPATQQQVAAPGTPGGISASAASTSRVDVSWTAPGRVSDRLRGRVVGGRQQLAGCRASAQRHDHRVHPRRPGAGHRVYLPGESAG